MLLALAACELPCDDGLGRTADGRCALLADVDPLADFAGLPACDVVLPEDGEIVDLGVLAGDLTVCGTLRTTGHDGDAFTGDVDVVRLTTDHPVELTAELAYEGEARVHLQARVEDLLVDAVGGPDAPMLDARPLVGQVVDLQVAAYAGEPTAYALVLHAVDLLLVDRVASGGDLSCVVDDGEPVCWGRYAEELVEEAPEGEWATLAPSERSICALDAEGYAACWGDASPGEPPEGTFVALSIARLAGASQHACGLRATGEVACWGTSRQGQTDVPEGTYRAVSAGSSFTCAIDSDGAIVCWGEGNRTDPPGGAWSEVGAGDYFNCAIPAESEGVTCWETASDGAHFEAVGSAPATGRFHALTVGEYHACALDDDDALVCWGGPQTAVGFPDVPSWRDVSAGELHTCAVRYDGALECWGAWWLTDPP
ncbi:MAG: RCC1 domain-containing protein [Myxococcota bacterium]